MERGERREETRKRCSSPTKNLVGFRLLGCSSSRIDGGAGKRNFIRDFIMVSAPARLNYSKFSKIKIRLQRPAGEGANLAHSICQFAERSKKRQGVSCCCWKFYWQKMTDASFYYAAMFTKDSDSDCKAEIDCPLPIFRNIWGLEQTFSTNHQHIAMPFHIYFRHHRVNEAEGGQCKAVTIYRGWL